MNGKWVPWMVVGILGMSVIANMIMIRYAVADPTFAIEPNYYDEALAWDARAAQHQANARLGWTLVPRLTHNAAGEAMLDVEARDAGGRPLSDVTFTVNASPNLCARQRTHAVVSSGQEARLGSACPGLWRLDVEARRATDLYVARLVTEMQ
jgi:nitrogen fixation protein FixH